MDRKYSPTVCSHQHLARLLPTAEVVLELSALQARTTSWAKVSYINEPTGGHVLVRRAAGLDSHTPHPGGGLYTRYQMGLDTTSVHGTIHAIPSQGLHPS
jgi:hypothetical protein